MAITLTAAEKAELIREGFKEGTTYYEMYHDARDKDGLNHKDALKRVVDGVANLQSDSFSKGQIETLQRLIKKVPGQFFGADDESERK